MSEREHKDLTPADEQRIQASLRALGEVRADAAFAARLREQFQAGTIPVASDPDLAAAATPGPEAPAQTAPPRVVELPRRRFGRRWSLVALPAIAAALAIFFLGGGDPRWQLEDVRGVGDITVAGRTVASTDRTGVADLIEPGARFEVPAGVELDIVLDGVMVIGVAGPAAFTLPLNPREAPFAYEAVVESGEVRFKSGPEFAGRRAVLRTTEGTAVVTGTAVAVYKNAEVTCVCVLEGAVMVGRDADHMNEIPAGMRKVMFADGSEPKIVPIEPGHRDGLIDFERHNAGTFD